MTDAQRLALDELEPRLLARRAMRGLEYRSDVRLTADQVYDLTLNASGDQELAEKAFHEFRKGELKSGQTPG
mgnify:CR=1 FL=1